MRRSDKRKKISPFTRMTSNLLFHTPMPKTQHVFRNEYKYILNRYEYEKYLNICKKYMEPDPYCDETGKYFISSLYFDGIADNDYFDKELGAFDRKKMRIRTYGYDYDWAHFEMKRKVDIWEYKDKVRLSREEVKMISEGNFDPLLGKGTDEAVRFYVTLKEGVYRPRAIVEYERRAFILPFEDVRVTFDEDVRYTVSDFDLFKKKVMTPQFPDGHVVFEIKYNEILPRWAKKMLSGAGLSNEAVSKYSMSRKNNI